MASRRWSAGPALAILIGLAACGAATLRPSELSAEVEAKVERGQVDEALASADRVLEQDPLRADAWRQRCRCLVLQRELDAALLALEEALRLEHDDAWSHYERGYILNEMGRHGEALGSLDRAVGLAPRFYKAREHRAATLMLLKRPAEAVEEFGVALEVWEIGVAGRRDVLRQRAEAWDALGNSAAAAADRELAEGVQDPD